MENSQKQIPQFFQVLSLLIIFIGYVFLFFQTGKPLGERFFVAGAGLLFSFLFYYLVGAILVGASKFESFVSIKSTTIIITISVMHFIIGGYLGVDT